MAKSETVVKKKRVRKADRDRSTVIQYPYFDDLAACLNSGWSAHSTREYLINKYGEEGVPHERAIGRWKQKHLTEAGVIPHQFILEKLKGVDYKVDVLAHLSRLVFLLEERMGRGLSQEVNTFAGLPLPINDGVVRVYLEALMNYVKVAQDLGILKGPPAPIFDMRTQNLNVTPEALKALVEVAKEIKALGRPMAKK